MPARFLVQTPETETFFQMAQIESGLSALLGEPRDVDPLLGPEYQKARMAVRDGVKKVEALASDPTRSEPEKHAAGLKIANGVIDTLQKFSAAAEKRALAARDEADREAELALGPKANRGALESDIRSAIRRVAREAEGLNTIREYIEDSPDAAAVVYHSRHWLLGIPKAIHEELRLEAMEKAAPNAYRMLTGSFQLSRFPERVAKVVATVKRTFYNPGTAEQAKRRVEV